VARRSSDSARAASRTSAADRFIRRGSHPLHG
jgi:hypothetical protein